MRAPPIRRTAASFVVAVVWASASCGAGDTGEDIDGAVIDSAVIDPVVIDSGGSTPAGSDSGGMAEPLPGAAAGPRPTLGPGGAIRPPDPPPRGLLPGEILIESANSMTVGRMHRLDVTLVRLGEIVAPSPAPPADSEVLRIEGTLKVGDSARVCVRGGPHFSVENHQSGEPCDVQEMEPGVSSRFRYHVTPSDTMGRALAVSVATWSASGGRRVTFDTAYSVLVANVALAPTSVGDRFDRLLTWVEKRSAQIAAILGSLVAISAALIALRKRGHAP